MDYLSICITLLVFGLALSSPFWVSWLLVYKLDLWQYGQRESRWEQLRQEAEDD